MNYLGINCSVSKGLGNVTVVILNENNEIFRNLFQSPSVFSFNENSAEILNWHRDNIISLVTNFNIEGIVIKKTEQNLHSKIKKSDIFKLYLEGVMLSLAGSVGIANKHYYKTNIQRILGGQNIFDLSIDDICTQNSLNNYLGDLKSNETVTTQEALLAVISLKKELSK